MPEVRHAESLEKVLIGWQCYDCGWTYETQVGRCYKCNSYAIEELTREFLVTEDKSRVKQLYYKLKEMRYTDD